MTKVRFADRAACDDFLSAVSNPAIDAEIAADEKTLFDRSKSRSFLLDERESDLT